MRNAIVFLVLAVTVVCRAQVLQVDVTGQCNYINSWGSYSIEDHYQYQVNDTLVFSFLYDVDQMGLLDYQYSEEDLPAIYWEWKLRASVSEFSVKILRESVSIFEYTQSNMPVAFVTSVTGSEYEPESTSNTWESFLFRCSLSDQRIPNDWNRSISYSVNNKSGAYSDPFAPSTILNPDSFSRSHFSIFNNHDNGAGQSDGQYQYDFAIDSVNVTPVPEPVTFSILAAGALGLLRFRRRDSRIPCHSIWSCHR